LTGRKSGLLRVVGPGLLVAATGVGAGDLATAAFTGSQIGLAVLWAVVVGAFLKFVLNEGLARWQLATGETLLGGAIRRIGRPVSILFPFYLLPWSFFVGSALVSACGVTIHAMLPVFEDAATGKVVFGVAASLAGLALVQVGGYRLFERVMGVCIGVMFLTVVVTAVLLRPDWGAVVRGIFLPSVPSAGGQGLTWTVALMGGVGGTLTVLCYGYWIREEGRESPDELRTCRIDLGVGYGMTLLFGLAMVIIGSSIRVAGKGAGLVVTLAEKLEEPLGPVGRWVFLVGAFGAVFSSLLGVWQAVPYVFADYLRLVRKRREPVDTKSRAYRGYMYGLALVPLLGLLVGFREVQKLYAVVGALFMPLLALCLLYLNGRTDWVGARLRNRPATAAVLLATLVMFVVFGYFDLRRRLGF
jgi:Mn2+/Fe2+ NRAMP family transporter